MIAKALLYHLLKIEDTGATTLNPLKKVPLETEPFERPLAQRLIGGLGIFLTFPGVDKFIYEKLGDRNQNILVVNRANQQ